MCKFATTFEQSVYFCDSIRGNFTIFIHAENRIMKHFYVLFIAMIALISVSFGSAAPATTTETASIAQGVASYYADIFQGRRTANGERYDKNKLTAAHRTLPFGTNIKITRNDNRQSVVVRVNDRGPHTQGRMLDISRAAAEKIGLIRAGKASVTMEIIGGKNHVLLTEENADELLAILNENW